MLRLNSVFAAISKTSHVLGMAVLLLLLCGRADAKDVIFPLPPEAYREATLKENYKSFFLVGNVISPGDLTDDGLRFETLTNHFDILTAENAMKPLYIQGQKGIFTFETADALVDAVLQAGLKVHGHTLVWHQQSPEWINREGISRDEAVENLITHAKTVAGHFKGRVLSWDVVNEAIIDNPQNPADWRSALRQTPWYKAIGPDYIEIVFKAAREADPGAILYYNDYNLDSPAKAAAVCNMVKELNEKFPNVGGRPLIDGVGMQGHYRLRTSMEYVSASIQLFASLGVEVSITELDVQAGENRQLTEAQALEQGIVYARLFAIFREHASSLGRVTIWGLDDGRSWRSPTSPTLFDKDLNKKPAFFGALNPAPFLAKNEKLLPVVERSFRQAEARYGVPSLDPTDPLWITAPAIPIDQNVMAWQGAGGSARVLWDEQNLYVLVTVGQAELNKDNRSPHEQDSVEIFIDEGNHKAAYIQNDDGQYRVNFDNEQSFSTPAIAAGFESRAVVHSSASAYTVAVKIPFKTIQPKENTLIGFDLQINGASSRGIRQSVTAWNDTTNNGWQDPSLYGTLKLTR